MRLNIFTLIKWCDIILVVKRLALLTIPVLAAFALGGVTASAAVNEPIYPGSDADFKRPLYFTSLNDYAIEDELFVFADGNSIKILDGKNYDKYDFDSEFTAVDIVDGTIFCLSQEKSYFINFEKEKNPFDEIEHSFTDKTDRILYGDYLYFTNGNGLNIFDMNIFDTTTYNGAYTDLKQYGDKVYTIKDNLLYSLTGTEIEAVKLEYEVNAKNVKIEIGQALTALKQYSEVQFVKIEQDTIMTEIDLGALEGIYFVPKNIVKAKEGEVALLLCRLEDLAVVAIGESAYAILNPTDKISRAEIDYTTEIPFESAQSISENIYASPFVVSGTATFSKAHGATVKVISRIKSEILECSFCEVEYEDGESTVKGYIAEYMLQEEIREDKKDPAFVSDQNYSESNNTKTILIILAVIVLLLVAILYIAHVSSKGKKKKKKTDDKDE